MARDWEAVSRAIQARSAEMDLNITDLARRSGLAFETARELHGNLKPRRRAPRTLAAMSLAIDRPAGYLEAVLNGADPDDPSAGADPAADEMAAFRATLADLVERVERLERGERG